jgi:metal-dependent HD superfamily phosphatase/phosphodiesterase
MSNPDQIENVDTPLFTEIAEDPEIQCFLKLADEHLGAIGFTEHGVRHAKRVSKWSAMVVKELGLPDKECELARIAGYLHDIGNFICRADHWNTGASLCYQLLKRFSLDTTSLGVILSAIGNHEEPYGNVYNNVCAAVMIADKSDVHRSRVRSYDPAKGDMHDDVNYAVTRSQLVVLSDTKEIHLKLEIDNEIASVMDYFEIFLGRMVMCRNASQYLGCDFRIICNGTSIS